MSRYFVEHDPLTYFALVASLSVVIMTIGSCCMYLFIISCGGTPAVSLPYGALLGSLGGFIFFLIVDLGFEGNFFRMRGEPIYLFGEFMGYATDLSGRWG